MVLSLLRALHVISYVPKLTFSFFLSVSKGCFAGALRGVRATSSSAASTVRPFGCTGNKKESCCQTTRQVKPKIYTQETEYTTIKFYPLYSHVII